MSSPATADGSHSHANTPTPLLQLTPPVFHDGRSANGSFRNSSTGVVAGGGGLHQSHQQQHPHGNSPSLFAVMPENGAASSGGRNDQGPPLGDHSLLSTPHNSTGQHPQSANNSQLSYVATGPMYAATANGGGGGSSSGMPQPVSYLHPHMQSLGGQPHHHHHPHPHHHMAGSASSVLSHLSHVAQPPTPAGSPTFVWMAGSQGGQPQLVQVSPQQTGGGSDCNNNTGGANTYYVQHTPYNQQPIFQPVQIAIPGQQHHQQHQQQQHHQQAFQQQQHHQQGHPHSYTQQQPPRAMGNMQPHPHQYQPPPQQLQQLQHYQHQQHQQHHPHQYQPHQQHLHHHQQAFAPPHHQHQHLHHQQQQQQPPAAPPPPVHGAALSAECRWIELPDSMRRAAPRAGSANTAGAKVFVGQARHETTPAHVAAIFELLGGASPTVIRPAGKGCFVTFFGDVPTAQSVSRLNRRLLLDHGGAWFAESDSAVVTLHNYVNGPGFRNTGQMKLPKQPMVIEYQPVQ